MVVQHFLGKEELEHGSQSTADHLASLIRVPQSDSGGQPCCLTTSLWWASPGREET
jgi:hypothetical protein